jgi:MFS family permease
MHGIPSETVCTVSRRTNDVRRVGLACAIGTAIERYDFFIYGTAAAVVFAPQFFPRASDLAGRLAALATFAVGFIALPLGSLVMGHFGDRIGRKSMLVWSLLLMGAATFGIGLLPSYAEIGLWAPALLVVLRWMQGFALGGEWGGAVLMSVEHAPARERGHYGGYVAIGLPVGLCLANLIFLFTTTSVSHQQFIEGGWRIPFLASAVLVIVGLLIRAGVGESPVFAEVLRRRARHRVPMLDVVRGHWRTVLLAAGSYLSSSSLGYVATVYFVSYATHELQFALTTALVLLVLASVAFAASVAMFATGSDQWGRRRVMAWGQGALAVWTLIFFPLIDTKSVTLNAIALCGMLFLQGPYLGSQPAAFAEAFPASLRYSGASLSATIGIIVGGAIAPFIATTLFGLTGSSRWITVYLFAVAVISWLCSLGLTRHLRM